ncbi:hypothetical protein [Vannielia litorea]|uniref:hypothetical protein n=1 Tax=Vannielia litorea TaxID=1217970 RepID=UPI001BCFD262|nr:hypothetical protein [Vannielia litorea]MBS8228177.1 hypothetical protein [Vannielia litorea]
MARAQGNSSTAVMARRHSSADSLDYFPTPPWATRALTRRIWGAERLTAWEPACGEMHMARVLRESFRSVAATDIVDYGAGQDGERDFLLDWPDGREEVDWIITNPPFNRAAEFVHRALDMARFGCAMLLRTAFLESAGRYHDIFARTPPNETLIFAERVVMASGLLLDPSQPYWCAREAKWKQPSTATSYAWFIWRHGAGAKFLDWIPPGSRAALERPGDYPGNPQPPAPEGQEQLF